MTTYVERALARVSRPLVVGWTGIDREAHRASWRATAIRRAQRLRGAYRDLDPASVPGHVQCAEMHRALGIDAKNPRAGDSLLTRALSSNRVFEPDRGIELDVALALELMVPIAVGWCDGVPLRVEIRFGRDGERIKGRPQGGDDASTLRGRAIVTFDGSFATTPASSGLAGEAVDELARDLIVVAFLPIDGSDGDRVERIVKLAESVVRTQANYFELATVAAGTTIS